MTINSVTEMWSRATGTESSDDGRVFNASYASAYQVEHSADSTVDEIKGATGIPNINDTYKTYPFVYCTSKGPVERIGPVYSIVPVQWEGQISLNSDDPTIAPPDYQYDAVVSSAEIDEDADGIPICNTIGEPATGITKPIADMSLTVKRAYLAVNGSLALQYLDSVNVDNFNVFGDVWAPGQAAMSQYRIQPVINAQTFQPDYFMVTCKIDLRQPYNTVAARAHFARYRNEGMYERYGTTVTFSGGGGSGAAGYAIASSGAVTDVIVTSRGQGYSSAPSVSFSSTTGGTGATATASLGTGDHADEVVSVSVGAGGSGYKSGIERATDANKEPVTRPVLLAANGRRLEDTDEAFWVERRVKQYWLNYTSLGLLG